MNALVQHPPAVRTTCPYCGVGCGILASPDGQGGAAIAGDPLHPANKGRLCSKGAALGETLELGGRLLYPMVRKRDGALARVPWSDALDRVANGFRSIAERDGSDAIAFYLSGQLLTEDYYVANKLMKGFMGSANVDTNSRLCMASSVSGHRRAFGSDTVPCHYEDLDEADLIILVGSNAAWCHPVLFQRMMRNKQDRKARIVVIDPRRTPTAESADLHLAILPGQDTTLFCGLLVHLAEALALDYGYIDTHCAGFENALVRAREIAPDVISTALSCGLQQDDVARFFDWFRDTPRSVTCYSQGVNQSAQGTDKVNAIINCHLATGRIGRLGMGPFSLTGQPNAMGGREVGGLANQLAAHMGFSSDEVDRVRRFWNAPRIATREGLKAVDMFEAIEAGTVKALWVMATNPAVSLPRANAMRDALRKLELLVVSENVRSNDTINAGAHVLLPAAAWGEKDGTVTNSERRISRQRAFLRPPGEARPDWWMVTEISRRLGFGEAFPYSNAADIFREHAALSGFENHGGRDFDIGDLAEISDETFDALEPVQWPQRKQAKSEQRFFTDGGFFTPDGKARFVAPAQPRLRTATSAEQPLLLNTGRIRDQWHTMTRTGQSPRLAGHIPEPFIEVHPIDATAFGLRDGGVARVSSAYGTCLLKVVISEGQRQGSVFAPIHWSDETASAARIGALLGPYVDPYSGQPEAKAIPVAIAPIEFLYRGFALVRSPVSWPSCTWWAQVALAGGVGILIATNESPAIWQARMAQIFNSDHPQYEHAEYRDEQFGHYRFATFLNGRIESCFFIGTGDSCPPWDIVKSAFAQNPVSETQRRLVLSGRSGADVAQAGKLVCACFGVGLTMIRDAFETGLATNVEELGRVLNAGTNCGSCVPEIKRIMAHERSSATV